MFKDIRRVVTGLSKNGESTVIFDSTAHNLWEHPDWPGLGTGLLWRIKGIPVDNSSNADTTLNTGSTMVLAPEGVEFMVCHFPPQSTLKMMSPEQRAKAQSVKGNLPSHAKVAPELHPGMHQHNTTDCITVLSGEITLILEECEVTLKTGDTLLQRASVHAWENRGDVPTILTSVSLGAKPIS